MSLNFKVDKTLSLQEKTTNVGHFFGENLAQESSCKMSQITKKLQTGLKSLAEHIFAD